MKTFGTQGAVCGKIQAKRTPKYSMVSQRWYVTFEVKPFKGSKIPVSISAPYELELGGIPLTGTEVKIVGEMSATPHGGRLNSIRLVSTPDKITVQ